ncbi:GAF and ANTAR domain-containing protein [Arthrobacter sp. PAMC25284]|uniref:GAF and ANTAR domain-containing protein n=1 Tax=Arthrobacter sp. PAMC25284 TaxID=2861279 RepID=UPI001C629EAE|nr:GAF and ANTAR domain-containing protein [Arthrobacter sp. PAMC25284]QYF88641.1 GAF and ANTAR domain-containing protein [Arthrobacter sp. PAMC25284]
MLQHEQPFNPGRTLSPGGSQRAIDQVQNLILESADFEGFLNELARFSAHQVAGSGEDALCGITLLRDRKAATIGWSSDSAREVDEIQYSLSQGPCLSAAKEEREIYVPDLFDEDRWGSDYANAVAAHGLRSVLSVPFHLQGEAQAALNLYSDVPHKFDGDVAARARGFTREISQALRLAVRFALHTDSAINLRATLKSRTIIDMAVGIVMAQNRCSQEEAVRILTSASSNGNVKLRDIAASLVQSVSGGSARTHFDDPGEMTG